MTFKKTKKGTELPLIQVRGGADYLEVKWRLVWFREDHPKWGIQTELKEFTSDVAMVKATIRNEEGLYIAQAHKICSARSFGNYLEKAETGAIGRALAICGYGTQFSDEELDEGDIVDAPVSCSQEQVSGQPVYGVDGVEPEGYRIPYGSFKKRSLEQVGAEKLEKYLESLCKRVDSKQVVLTDEIQDMIIRMEQYINDEKRKEVENGKTKHSTMGEREKGWS
jgi:hypothetical protein